MKSKVNFKLTEERTGTYSTVFDERVAQLRHFVPGHGNLLQEKFPSLFHHFLAAGQVLTEARDTVD